MIFDMHCHVREGSCDSTVSVEDTIIKLKSKGYDGCLITDHNSYKGYESIKKKPKDFVVLKGIEYDSKDSGHLLIVLPEDVKYKIFEYRGMLGQEAIDITHKLGGIIGPAHPFDYFKLGICNTKFKNDLDYINQFDFIETFNGSLNVQTHLEAEHLARLLNLPCFGGSDSHHISRVGFGQTIIFNKITSTDDLIELVKSSQFNSIEATGSFVDRFSIRMHNFYVELGGFCYGMMNKCLPQVTRGQAQKVLELLDN